MTLTPKRRILIVDDEPDILWSLSLLLEPTYDVATAEDGFAALQALEHERFDAMVLDLMMPIMDGITLKREMDTRGFTPPIVIVSAFSDLAARAKSMGVSDYITKPIDIPLLEATLARLTGSGSPSGGTTPSDVSGQGGRSHDAGGSLAHPRLASAFLVRVRSLAGDVALA